MVRACWRCLEVMILCVGSRWMHGSWPMKPHVFHRNLLRLCVPCGPAVRVRGWPCYRQPGAGRIRSGRLGTMAVKSWLRLEATVDTDPTLFSPAFLQEEKINLGEEGYNREYLGIPSGGQVSPFTWEMYQQATRPVDRKIFELPTPVIIAHDVGRSRDRSTAVAGGSGPLAPGLVGIRDFEELPLGLSGHARAEALAEFDRGCSGRALIIADVSNDETYGEVLVERFGGRVIGLHITRHGDGMSYEWRTVKNGRLLVYTIGRTYLFDLLFREMQNDKVRILDGANSQRAYEQLMNLEKEIGQSGIIYRCLPGRHDDLAISCAMLVWAAHHPHLQRWCWPLEQRARPTKRPAPSALGWT